MIFVFIYIFDPYSFFILWNCLWFIFWILFNRDGSLSNTPSIVNYAYQNEQHILYTFSPIFLVHIYGQKDRFFDFDSEIKNTYGKRPVFESSWFHLSYFFMSSVMDLWRRSSRDSSIFSLIKQSWPFCALSYHFSSRSWLYIFGLICSGQIHSSLSLFITIIFWY